MGLPINKSADNYYAEQFIDKMMDPEKTEKTVDTQIPEKSKMSMEERLTFLERNQDILDQKINIVSSAIITYQMSVAIKLESIDQKIMICLESIDSLNSLAFPTANELAWFLARNSDGYSLNSDIFNYVEKSKKVEESVKKLSEFHKEKEQELLELDKKLKLLVKEIKEIKEIKELEKEVKK